MGMVQVLTLLALAVLPHLGNFVMHPGQPILRSLLFSSCWHLCVLATQPCGSSTQSP